MKKIVRIKYIYVCMCVCGHRCVCTPVHECICLYAHINMRSFQNIYGNCVLLKKNKEIKKQDPELCVYVMK